MEGDSEGTAVCSLVTARTPGLVLTGDVGAGKFGAGPAEVRHGQSHVVNMEISRQWDQGPNNILSHSGKLIWTQIVFEASKGAF